jgi:vacuolar-type H+-ATPase subunit E/Vma4
VAEPLIQGYGWILDLPFYDESRRKEIGRIMNSVEENVETLSRAILSEARGETDQLSTEAEAKAQAIRQRAQEQAEAERKSILEEAAMEAERLRSQTLATAQMKARAIELDHREKLLDRVFRAVQDQLPSVQKRPDYEKIVVSLVREALIQLKAAKAEIRADKITQKILTKTVIDEISKDMKVQLSIGKPLDQGTGVAVTASDGHLSFDNTLETRLTRFQGRLRSSVYRILMGESA